MILSEFGACKNDFDTGNIYPELVPSFFKVSKLIEVLFQFDISAKEKKQYADMIKFAAKRAIDTKKLLQQQKQQKEPEKDIRNELARQNTNTNKYHISVAPTNNNINLVQDSEYDDWLPVSSKPIPDRSFSKNIDFSEIYFMVSW